MEVGRATPSTECPSEKIRSCDWTGVEGQQPEDKGSRANQCGGGSQPKTRQEIRNRMQNGMDADETGG